MQQALQEDKVGGMCWDSIVELTVQVYSIPKMLIYLETFKNGEMDRQEENGG